MSRNHKTFQAVNDTERELVRLIGACGDLADYTPEIHEGQVIMEMTLTHGKIPELNKLANFAADNEAEVSLPNGTLLVVWARGLKRPGNHENHGSSTFQLPLKPLIWIILGLFVLGIAVQMANFLTPQAQPQAPPV